MPKHKPTENPREIARTPNINTEYATESQSPKCINARGSSVNFHGGHQLICTEMQCSSIYSLHANEQDCDTYLPWYRI